MCEHARTNMLKYLRINYINFEGPRSYSPSERIHAALIVRTASMRQSPEHFLKDLCASRIQYIYIYIYTYIYIYMYTFKYVYIYIYIIIIIISISS